MTQPGETSYGIAPLGADELILETPRLLLRPLVGDAADLALSVRLFTDPENAASRHVLKKCGLRDDGLRRAYGCDCSGFSITRAAWEAKRRAE